MSEEFSDKEMAEAREEYYEEEKQRLVDSFEKGGREKTDYSVTWRGDVREFYYGLPIMENGELLGFEMMKFEKFYDMGMGFRGDDHPWTDDKGKQIVMTIDEYFDFYKELGKKDGRLGAFIRRSDEEKAVMNKAGENKIKKLRRVISEREKKDKERQDKLKAGYAAFKKQKQKEARD